MNNNDLIWLHENCIGDNNFCDNISVVNRRVGFLTGTYWAWKNYDKLGNPEYFGSFGYRKLLAPSFLKNINNYDIILPEKTETITTLKKQIIDCHGIVMYDAMIKLMGISYPEELENFINYLKMDCGYFYELYVMKQNIFFEFCTWVFKVLNNSLSLFSNAKIENHCNIPQYGQFLNMDNKSEVRDIAFIIERITGYYLYKLTQKENTKYCEVPVLSTEDLSMNVAILKKIREKVKNV